MQQSCKVYKSQTLHNGSDSAFKLTTQGVFVKIKLEKYVEMKSVDRSVRCLKKYKKQGTPILKLAMVKR